jgi:hypothetical protein
VCGVNANPKQGSRKAGVLCGGSAMADPRRARRRDAGVGCLGSWGAPRPKITRARGWGGPSGAPQFLATGGDAAHDGPRRGRAVAMGRSSRSGRCWLLRAPRLHGSTSGCAAKPSKGLGRAEDHWWRENSTAARSHLTWNLARFRHCAGRARGWWLRGAPWCSGGASTGSFRGCGGVEWLVHGGAGAVHGGAKAARVRGLMWWRGRFPVGAAGWFKEGAPRSRRARPIRKAGEHLGRVSRCSVANARRGGDETDGWARGVSRRAAGRRGWKRATRAGWTGPRAGGGKRGRGNR